MDLIFIRSWASLGPNVAFTIVPLHSTDLKKYDEMGYTRGELEGTKWILIYISPLFI